jgi:hypothetical protein
MTDLPMQLLSQAMRQHGLVRFVEHFAERFPDCHLKDLVVDEVDAPRQIEAVAPQLDQRVTHLGRADEGLALQLQRGQHAGQVRGAGVIQESSVAHQAGEQRVHLEHKLLGFGVDWDTLGIVQLTGSSNTLVVQVTNKANAIVFAEGEPEGVDMAKNIVFCADGTWNERDQVDKITKKRRPTNVTKVARAVRPRRQIAAARCSEMRRCRALFYEVLMHRRL